MLESKLSWNLHWSCGNSTTISPSGWVGGGWSDKAGVFINFTQFKFKLKMKLEFSLVNIYNIKLKVFFTICIWMQFAVP